MLRAIALSLFLFIGIGTVIPFTGEYAEASAYKHGRHKKLRKYKKYSKNWWRQYYRRQQRNNSSVAQRRAVRLRQIRLANMLTNSSETTGKYPASILKGNQKSAAESALPAVLPTGEAAPIGWRRGVTGSPSEMQFTVDDETGANVGSASVSVVGAAVTSAVGAAGKTVGGVQTSSLRRTVIDRMIREEGWVVNDYQKEIGGRRVFVVVAQSPGAGGKMQSRLFYFTESGGQIYSVATSAPANGGNAQRLERDSERVVTALGQRRNGAVQQAELK